MSIVLSCAASGAQPSRRAAARTTPQAATKSLASETFNLTEESEVGLEIVARSPGASWARKGAEASALLVSVDGAYNQDVLLWAGEESYPYRVMLGRLARGRHTVSVSLNTERSAAGARRAEIKALRPLPFPTSRASGDLYAEQLALSHSPIIYARANTIDRFTDIPLLMYYEILREGAGDLVVRYTAVFTNEDGGTQTAALMSRWGRATDIEWVYELRVRGGQVVEETYQGVQHETKFFKGSRAAGAHPLLADASDNNNFTDLACSAVRFAPLPERARLESATRESVMDLHPQTYRVMVEELRREGRISETPADVNTIYDPREYLYVEAGSGQEGGAAIAFDVKLAGQDKTFSTDMGDARLRIERSGYFRTAVHLPKGTNLSAVESVTARCGASPKPTGAGRCVRLKFLRVLMLDENFVPRPVAAQPQPEASLALGETKVFKLARP
ncbi:MAG: hypothetical protein LC785_06900 [Acidobacteria bacterium]|nr:hypothetical protein [Acidobacteriota bacterium]MCA1641664.1 hypothetical protein [Acidobacteriota bacterium]